MGPLGNSVGESNRVGGGVVGAIVGESKRVGSAVTVYDGATVGNAVGLN